KVPGTQPLLQHVLDKLLAKDLDRRYQIIHDARTDLAEAMDSPPRRAVPSIEGIAPARTGLRTIMSAAMLVLASVAITVAVMRILQETPSLVPPASLVRAVIKLEPGLKLAALPTREEADYGYDRPSRTAMAISPDGRYLVYSAIGTVSPEREPDELGPRERAEQAGQPQLYLRALSEADARPIAGTDGGVCPFFSPDGQWIGFRTDAELRKVSVAGGPPVNICELPLRGWGPGHNVLGASWGSGETIAFAHVDGGLWKVPSSGGKPEVLTSLDPSRNERTHRLPFLLPDGKAVIFTVMDSTRSSSPRIELQSLTSGERKVLIENGADARYAPSGHLVYARKGVMMAAPFDARRLEVTGAPVSVGQVMQALVYPTYQSLNTGAAQFSFSTSGSLVYVPGDVYPTPVRDLIWVDRQGKEQVVESLDQFVSAPRISPDGLFVAYHAINANGHHQIWLYDLPRKNRIQFSFEGDASQPMWTPDAKRLVFAFSDAPNRPNNIYWQAADRSSPMERLTSSEYPRVAGSWSRDGRYLAFTETHPSTKVDICVLQMEDRKVVEAVKSPADDVTPAFSPDGRFLAYASLESGDLEVYVQPFPGPGARNKISTGGGREPVWSPDGRELFYRDPSERRVMVVDIRTEPAFSAGTPRTLFEGPNPYFAATPQQYDVAPNGRRFLMLRRRQHVETITEMILVHNWFEELKRLVPAGR
ncbi:MAG: hypothetical protein FJW35_08960, partial [Acidobacteria bacterium]|nr:hypothetical protein [Acidobacteriota bacterium]